MFSRSFSVLALGLVLVSACSHNKPNDEPDARRSESRWNGGPGRRHDMLLRGIELSSDQRQRVDSIRAQYRDQMRALWSNGSDREQSRAKMRDLMEQQTSDIRAVLTPEQQKVFDQNVEQMRAHTRDREERSDHPAPPAP